MDRIAVVILNWNGLEFLKRFLPSVITHSSEPGTGIYLADNGSDDGSAGWVEKNHDSVRIIRLEKNHGFAEGYNLALKQVRAEYYVLLNSDIEVTRGWLNPLVSFLETNPGAAACQPKIRSWHRREYFEYAGAAGGYIDKYGYPFCRGRLFSSIEKDHGQYEDKREVFWTTGACMMIRSDAWQKCSGLDPDFFAHMEEIDLCWRLLLSGYHLYYIPQSVVYHVGGGMLPYDSPYKTYLNFRNSLIMLYKNLPAHGFRRMLFIRKILDGMAALLFLLSGKPRSAAAVWRAHMDYYRSKGQRRKKRSEVVRLFPGNPGRLILNKSIVFWFYIRGIRTFNRIGANFSSE